ncbi:MAG: lipid-A-disaccharide synthase [Lentisphaeria bacterium]
MWIIAGESSGDAYGAGLTRELKDLYPGLKIGGMGGVAMREAGADLLVDSSDLGVVGFAEVFKHLPTFLKIFQRLVKQARVERPAAVVLIDYPGFNLRFAEKMHKHGIPVVYYVSPQVWAWGKRRIPKMARVIDKMLVLFPFETEVFKSTTLDVEFVGHPLVELLEPYRCLPQHKDENLVLLLPGSRINEVKRLLQPMLDTAIRVKSEHPEKHFVIPAPGEKLYNFIVDFLQDRSYDDGPEIKVVRESARQWMGRADAGIAASGTVTVEAAILGLPLVVVYKVHWLTYNFARRLVKVPYFTMVNLVVQREVFREFLQGNVKPDVLAPALESICSGGVDRAFTEKGMQEALKALGGYSDVSRNTAVKVLETAGLKETASGTSA